MRLRIVAALDTNDETSDRDSDGHVIVDIDQRFVDQIFKDSFAMTSWCQSWNIITEPYEIAHEGRTSTRSKWMRFKKPDL